MFDTVVFGGHAGGLPNRQKNLDPLMDLVEWRDLLSLVSWPESGMRSIQIYDMGFSIHGDWCKLDCGVRDVMDDGKVHTRCIRSSLWKLLRVVSRANRRHATDRCL